MSRTEHWLGEIKLVADNENKEQFCKDNLGRELKDWENTYLEAFLDDNFDKYINTSIGLFKNNAEECNEDYISRIRKIDDKTYEINMRFYNGGTYLGEMVNDELEELKKKNEL